jgi:hypothetical protein
MKRLILLIAAFIVATTCTAVPASADMKAKIKVSGGGTYDYFIIGEMAAATDGFDNAYDSFYPGGNMNDTYIMSYLPHPEWGTVKPEFRSDMRSVADIQEWLAGVYTNLPNNTVLTLSLMEGTSIPAGYTLTVEDTENGLTADLQASSYSFTVTDNTQVRAFRIVADANMPAQRYALTIAVSGSGTVSADTGEISWSGQTGTAKYEENTPVTLTAAASGGYKFAGWSGCDSANQNTCMVTMTTAKAVGASFTPACSYSISPTGQIFPARGGKGRISVTATAGCDWTPTSDSSWIKIARDSRPGMVTYRVGRNTTGQERTGTITIGGQTVTVRQGLKGKGDQDAAPIINRTGRR